MIGIIDYGMSNLHSVKNACDYLNLDSVVSKDVSVLSKCDKLILPGVGAFQDCMYTLHSMGLYDFVVQQVKKDVPLLGICLGMQLLFEESEEYGPIPGLGLIPGMVKEIPSNLGLSVPHMGWNKNVVHQPHSAFSNVDDQYTYFVHSYYVDTDPEYITSTANYGIDVPGIVERGRVYGMQFHPEKSGVVGLNLLRTFGNITEAYGATKE